MVAGGHEARAAVQILWKATIKVRRFPLIQSLRVGTYSIFPMAVGRPERPPADRRFGARGVRNTETGLAVGYNGGFASPEWALNSQEVFLAEPRPAALQSKVALITGGSNGIGAATARIFAKKGAKVVVGYHRGAGRAEDLLKELPGDGHRMVQIVLEDSATIDRAAKTIPETYGRADILVNSAGFT